MARNFKSRAQKRQGSRQFRFFARVKNRKFFNFRDFCAYRCEKSALFSRARKINFLAREKRRKNWSQFSRRFLQNLRFWPSQNQPKIAKNQLRSSTFDDFGRFWQPKIAKSQKQSRFFAIFARNHPSRLSSSFLTPK
mgnify:CR=1 FL=1